jgi:hypothetical protein
VLAGTATRRPQLSQDLQPLAAAVSANTFPLKNPKRMNDVQVLNKGRSTLNDANLMHVYMVYILTDISVEFYNDTRRGLERALFSPPLRIDVRHLVK